MYQLRPYQQSAVDASVAYLTDTSKKMRNRNGIVVAPTGCLSGDTVVFTNRAGNGQRQTLATIFRAQTVFASRRKPGVVPYTRSFDGTRIGMHRFDQVVKSGIRKTWLLRLVDGTELRGTPDHKILTPSGFVAMSDLKTGQFVICDTPRPVKSVTTRRKRSYRQVQGLVYHPFASHVESRRKRHNWKPEGRLYRVPFHRLVVEAEMNSLPVDDLVLICRREPQKASLLGFLDPVVWAVHHKDEDQTNNAIGNLQAMSHEAHFKIHGDASHFSQGTPREVAVQSVRPDGETMTYDMLACHPHENFVANGIVVHNSGKSLLIANIVNRLPGASLVFQPTKEILAQNLEKLRSYGYHPSVYSASVGRKEIGEITLATIGSVKNDVSLFADVQNILIDECHLVNAKAGMYKKFLQEIGNCRVLGLTATPFRLASNSYGSELRFLTRTRPKVFSDLVHYTQIPDLFSSGYLCPLEYRDSVAIDRSLLRTNSTGADYTDASVLRAVSGSFCSRLVAETKAAIQSGRKPLIFTRFTKEAEALAAAVPGVVAVSAETRPKERDRIISEFRSGKIQGVANVGVLVCGFDYPELDCVILARPTLSLAVYYQSVGRVVRTHPNKQSAIIIDLVGVVSQFGRIEDLTLKPGGSSGDLWAFYSGRRRLTNIKIEPTWSKNDDHTSKRSVNPKLW